MATTKATTLAHTLGGIAGSIETAEINRLDGVNADIQTQLDAKAPKASPQFTGNITGTGAEGTSASLYLIADEGDDNGDGWRINSNQDVNDLTISNNTSGSYVDKFTLTSDGNVGINKTPTGTDNLQVKGVISSEATNSTNKWLAYTYTDNSYRLNYNGAGDDEIIITSDGYVRKTNHPFFCGRGNQSNVNITGSYNAIVFSDIINNAISQNTSTGKCSIPVAGKYMVNWTVGNQGSGNSSSYLGLSIFKNNGIEVSAWSFQTGYDHTTHCQVILNLSSSDTVAFTYRTDYGSPPTSTALTVASIYLIG